MSPITPLMRVKGCWLVRHTLHCLHRLQSTQEGRRKFIRYRILFQGTEDKYGGNRIFPNLGSFRSCSKHRIYVEISQNNINSVSNGYIIVEPKEQASKHDVHKNDCRWFSFYPSLTTCLNFMMTSGL